MIRVVLFDLDGVIRHFDPEVLRDIENRHGLAAGAISNTAFAAPLIDEVVTGRITRADWIARVGELIANPAAARAWGGQPWRVDPAVLRLSDELRRIGLRTAILTNGTDTIPDELADSGIAEHFDAVFNSAVIGFAKPDVRAFRHVLDALEVTGPEVFFTDDSPRKLVGADRTAMHTHRFRSVSELRRELAAIGVALRP